MLGYYRDPESTKEVLVNGVLHTWDLGYIDADGFLFITGRKSNLIIFSNGTKCSPEMLESEIVDNTKAEEVLIYPTASSVRSSLDAVVYLPDIDARSDVLNYISACLKHYQFDRIIFSSEPLPQNVTGKILRH